jgi:thermitase
MVRKEVVAVVSIVVLGLFFIAVIGLIGDDKRVTGFVVLEESDEFVPGEIIVKYRDGVVGMGNEVIVDEGGGDEVKIYDYVERPDRIEKIVDGKELYTLVFDEGVDVGELVEDYGELEEIEYVELNYIFRSFVVPDDSSYGSQGWMNGVGLERAWNLSKGKESVKIAVIDTGVDWNHPDLSFNIWNNSDEGCDDDVDLDGNGWFGDCRGYDFVDIDVATYIGLGYQLVDNEDYNVSDNDPMDFDGHGTHVAGIANGVSNNGEGIAGVCWNCSLMPVRAGFRIQLPSGGGVGSLEVDDVVSAIYYASENGADVISMSFGGGDSVSVRNAVGDAYGDGSILLAAAGNSGSEAKQYPCGYDDVLCVAATDGNDNKASYSTYGDWVSVSAPGSGILSTYFDDTYVSLSGTSMSTPVVAGSIGLIRSLFDKNQSEIESVLVRTGLDVDFNGVNIKQIDVYEALLSLDDIKPRVELVGVGNGEGVEGGDGFLSYDDNLSFVCNASDWQLASIELRIWNDSDLSYSEGRNVSGIFVEESFDVGLDYGDYSWNCLASDVNGNEGYAFSNYSFSVVEEVVNVVNLDRPLNRSYGNVSLVDFSCSIINGSGYDLMEFRLFNDSEMVYSESVEIELGNVNYSYNFSDEGDYEWDCLASGDNVSLVAGKFDFVYDVTNPVVSLLGPVDGESYSGTSEIDFNFDVGEYSACSLMVDGSVVDGVDLIGEGVIVESYGEGSYEWMVSCVDLTGNLGVSEVRGFEVNEVEDSGSGSGGSGSGGSSGGSSDGSSRSVESVAGLKKNYIISGEQVSEGYNHELKQGDEIQFVMLNGEEFEYSLRVNEIGVGYADLIVDGESVFLEVGDSAKLSLTNDEYYDLVVELVSINDEVVEVRIQKIDERIIVGGITGFAVDEVVVEDGNLYKFLEGVKGKGFRVGGNVVVIAIIGMVVLLLFFERRYIGEEIRKMHILSHKEKFNKYVKPDSSKLGGRAVREWE